MKVLKNKPTGKTASFVMNAVKEGIFLCLSLLDLIYEVFYRTTSKTCNVGILAPSGSGKSVLIDFLHIHKRCKPEIFALTKIVFASDFGVTTKFAVFLLANPNTTLATIHYKNQEEIDEHRKLALKFQKQGYDLDEEDLKYPEGKEHLKGRIQDFSVREIEAFKEEVLWLIEHPYIVSRIEFNYFPFLKDEFKPYYLKTPRAFVDISGVESDACTAATITQVMRHLHGVLVLGDPACVFQQGMKSFIKNIQKQLVKPRDQMFLMFKMKPLPLGVPTALGVQQMWKGVSNQAEDLDITKIFLTHWDSEVDGLKMYKNAASEMRNQSGSLKIENAEEVVNALVEDMGTEYFFSQMDGFFPELERIRNEEQRDFDDQRLLEGITSYVQKTLGIDLPETLKDEELRQFLKDSLAETLTLDPTRVAREHYLKLEQRLANMCKTACDSLKFSVKSSGQNIQSQQKKEFEECKKRATERVFGIYREIPSVVEAIPSMDYMRLYKLVSWLQNGEMNPEKLQESSLFYIQDVLCKALIQELKSMPQVGEATRKFQEKIQNFFHGISQYIQRISYLESFHIEEIKSFIQENGGLDNATREELLKANWEIIERKFPQHISLIRFYQEFQKLCEEC